MSLESLAPLHKKTRSSLSLKEFHSTVNVVFHDYESSQYDELHHDMKSSLQEQIDLLVDDLLQTDVIKKETLKLLDIGCGTGMSTQFLLESRLKSHINTISLLDTSSKMLEKAEEKAKSWNVEYELINAGIEHLHTKYDIIMICSVLHHIPNLEAFLKKIDALLNPGGILIHLQDPNGDYLNDSTYLERLKSISIEELKQKKRKSIHHFIPKKIKSFINNFLGRKNYIDLVNDKLMELKAIGKRMTADEIWSVTDIHVETKNSTENKGISFHFLEGQLQNFKLISHRSYGFFGKLKSDLPVNIIQKEDFLIQKKELNGRNISCVWMKKV